MLILICGPTRAGKTTYSQQFENDYKIIHLDYCGGSLKHRYENVKNMIKDIDGDVVVEGLYLTSPQREELIKEYKGNKTKCICINTPLETRKHRVGYYNMCEYYFELPTYKEGWDEIEIIEN